MSDYEANELFSYFNPKVTSLATFMPRLREGQDQVGILTFPEVEIPSHLVEQLGVFSGSLFFNKNEEQDNFLRFSGYCTSPRDHIQKINYDKGFINQNGYVPLENRQNVFGNVLGNDFSKFQEDPSDLLTKLLELRNYGIVPRSVHHIKIFNSGHRIIFK